MIASEVATRVRRTFGDEASVQVTDDDIIRWINDGQEYVVIKNEGLMEAKATADITASVAEYPVPTDMSVLRSLSLQGTHLKQYTFNEFNEYIDGFAAPSGLNNYGQGVPICYMVYNNTITLFPTPSTSTTGALYVYYIRHPTPVATLADSLSVPLQYHNAIVDYCLQQAYELDEDVMKTQMKATQLDKQLQELNDRNKWTAQEYYPGITVLAEDSNFGGSGYWGF